MVVTNSQRRAAQRRNVNKQRPIVTHFPTGCEPEIVISLPPRFTAALYRRARDRRARGTTAFEIVTESQKPPEVEASAIEQLLSR